jgi:hypothetical protein
MADSFYQGPSEEEVDQSLKKQPRKLVTWKASSLIVVGISKDADQQGTHPILYSLALWQRDFKSFPGATTLGRNYSQHMIEQWSKRDPEGDLIRDEKGQLIPLSPKDEADQAEYVRRMREVPSEAFGEEYSPKFSIDVEDSEQEDLVNKKYSWYRKGNALIYRQPTGKVYDPAEGHEKNIVLVEMTKAIRNILWTIEPKAKSGHTPLKQITGDEIHQLIFQRLQTASQRLQFLRHAFVEDLEANFLAYKVAVVSPRGISGIFDTVDMALDSVTQFYEAKMEQEEPMLAAASLSQEQAQILLRAADILDVKAPILARLFDEVFFSNAEKRDTKAFVSALIRVADKFDEEGKIHEAKLADSLINQITASFSGTKKFKI